MNQIGQFFSKLSNKMREYRDRARNRLYALYMHENGVYGSTKKRREASREKDASDQSSYSDYKTPAMFASAKRMAQRFVKTSASRAASSFRTPSDIPRHEKLNTTFCGRKIDWDQISLDGDDDDNSAGQELWSEKRNNGTWHLDQLSVKSDWIEQSRGSFTSPATAYQTFFTPKRFSPNRLSPQNAFPRTSSLLDISKADQAQAANSPDFSPGRTFDIPYSESCKRRISLPQSLKKMFSSTDLSVETNSPNETNSLSEDHWFALGSLELNSDAQAPIFNSSRIDGVVRVDEIEKIDEVDSEAKSHSVYDSGLGNRSSLISNDTANNECLSIMLDGIHDDEKVWKKGRVGVSRWYSFKNNDDLCLSPLSKDS